MGPGGLPSGTTAWLSSAGGRHLAAVRSGGPQCHSGDVPAVVGGRIRSTRPSLSTGVPTPSRLEGVSDGAPSGSGTTVHNRVYWPLRNSAGSPTTAPVLSSG